MRVTNLAKIVFSILVVFVLVFLISKTSHSLLTSSAIDGFKIDKKTSNYISFNYAENDGEFFKVDSLKKLSDFNGKKQKDFYEFTVSIPKKYVSGNKVDYNVVIQGIGNKVDEKNLKVYLTDKNNKPLNGYKDNVPFYYALPDTDDGKLLYTGSFNHNDLEDKYKLRIWANNVDGKKTNDSLVYQISINIK